jgi:hypothetical protein
MAPFFHCACTRSAIFLASKTAAKIRYYKDVPLCENYVRDFFIAAILPVSVKFVKIRHIARASRWQPIVFSLAAILAVSVMHSSSRVITRDQHGKLRAHLYST